jgi:hypothetical protein
VFAFVDASLKAQPSGTTLDVPVEASVLKSWVYATPGAVRLIPVAAADDDIAPPIPVIASASARIAPETSARRRVTTLSPRF